MPNTVGYKLLEACHESGCPICRLEQQGVERYLDNHFYESVNSTAWRDKLRASLGFCREHAWLGVNERLGDALGYAIIYHDTVNTILNQLREDGRPPQSSHHWGSLLGQIPEQVRAMTGKMLDAFTPRKRCPVCDHQDEIVRTILSVLADELETPAMTEALQASDGICLPHLRMLLGHIRDRSSCEKLLTIHRAKLDGLRTELAEFIRKNDYQVIQEGFGKEGDAWLRAISILTGTRKKS